jgi:tRNA threonylcarbamoyladenosine biosynthesis protein TsaE
MELLWKKKFAAEEMSSAAAQILSASTKHKIFFLKGNLGAGKTTLCQELVKKLGFTGRVSSPTFGLVNNYTLLNGEEIHHLDLYRLKKEEELMEAGIFEILNSGNYCFVEWPEIIESAPEGGHLLIEMMHKEDATREISLWRVEP